MSAEIKNITQIGIVTGDLYAMVDRYQKLYGIGPWEIRDGKKGFKDEAEDLMVYGKRQDFKVSLALCMAGNVQLELIQPLDEYSDYARHLKEHGEGHIHHISILTDNQAFRETMAERRDMWPEWRRLSTLTPDESWASRSRFTIWRADGGSEGHVLPGKRQHGSRLEPGPGAICL